MKANPVLIKASNQLIVKPHVHLTTSVWCKAIVLAIACIFLPIILDGQRVFTSKYRSNADVTLFETKIRGEADIVVFKVDYNSQVNPEKGFWREVRHQSQSQWVVFWVDRKSLADCIVFFSHTRFLARKNTCFINSKMTD